VDEQAAAVDQGTGLAKYQERGEMGCCKKQKMSQHRNCFLFIVYGLSFLAMSMSEIVFQT